MSVELTPANGFVLCWAPGKHVAIEDTLAAAICHAPETEGASEGAAAGTVMSSPSVACIDTSLVQTVISSLKPETSTRATEQAFNCSAGLSPPPPLARVLPLQRHSAFSHTRAPWLIRSVILLV